MASTSQLKAYYRLHAPWYDLTRWGFLFGRVQLQKQVIAQQPARVLEVGCGTGKNLRALAQALPNAKLLGLDLSEAMLAKARHQLKNHPNAEVRCSDDLNQLEGQFDVIVLSYVLSMVANQKQLIRSCMAKLKPDGHLAIVDFHYSPYSLFRSWMAFNHVDLSGKLLELCQQLMWSKQERAKSTKNQVLEAKHELRIKRAYLGLWQYFLLWQPGKPQ